MRTTRELLIILKKNIQLLQTGLCMLASQLEYYDTITDEECEYLREYIYDNIPKDRNLDIGLYYWPKGDLKSRLKYLNSHIRKLKDK